MLCAKPRLIPPSIPADARCEPLQNNAAMGRLRLILAFRVFLRAPRHGKLPYHFWILVTRRAKASLGPHLYVSWNTL
jgi:hypothetical protein